MIPDGFLEVATKLYKEACDNDFDPSDPNHDMIFKPEWIIENPNEFKQLYSNIQSELESNEMFALILENNEVTNYYKFMYENM